MSKQTITKEQLIKDLAITNSMLNDYIKKDEFIRKEFARAFRWNERGSWMVNDQPTLPTWEQIFVQVGVLLSADKFVAFDSQMLDLSQKIHRIEQMLNKKELEEPGY